MNNAACNCLQAAFDLDKQCLFCFDDLCVLAGPCMAANEVQAIKCWLRQQLRQIQALGIENRIVAEAHLVAAIGGRAYVCFCTQRHGDFVADVTKWETCQHRNFGRALYGLHHTG